MPASLSGRILLLALRVAALGLALLVAAGFLGRWHPAFDSIGHFRLHLSALALLAAVPLALMRRAEALAAVAAAALGIGSVHGPLAPAHAAIEPAVAGRPTYRLMHMNLRFDNAEPQKVLSTIERLRPDVITLNEVSSHWRREIEPLAGAYPHRIVCTVRGGAGGVAILSRKPFAGEARCLEGGTFAVAPVELDGRAIEVATVHLHWPWPFDQALHLDWLAGPLGGLGETALLAGDLNATPWSATAARVAAEGGLTPLPSPGATWLHRRLPGWLRFAGLPIDQAFKKGTVDVHVLTRLAPAGSDHLPLLLEFSLPPDGAPAASVSGG